MTAKDETAPSDNANSHGSPSYRDIVGWMIASLGLQVESDQGGVFELSVPESLQTAFGGEQWRFSFYHEREDVLHPSSENWSLLRRAWQAVRAALHVAPSRQAVQVHEISPFLLNAFEVEGGAVHLGGCTLEDRPLLMLLAICGGAQAKVAHFFFDRDGTVLDDQRIDTLGMREVTPLAQPPPGWSAEAAEQWIRQSKSAVEAAAPDACWLPIIVWCKYAEGKVVATIGESSVNIVFADWASRFAQGTAKPLGYTCPQTGVESHRIAATDEGLVTAAEAIGICQETGRRVLISDLGRCEASDRLVLKSLLLVCPASGRRVAESSLVACEMCRQQVDPGCLQNGRCLACRSLRSVRKADPRMAQVLGEYPKLDQWGQWRIAETRQVFILTAASFVRRLLIVMDKESMEMLHLAVGSRLSSRWSAAPASLRDELSRPSS